MLRLLAATACGLLLAMPAQAQMRNCANIYLPECSKSPFAPSGQDYGYGAAPYGYYTYGGARQGYYGDYGYYRRGYGAARYGYGWPEY
jgi:hypothetical protein